MRQMITIISLAFSTSKTPTLEVGVLEVEVLEVEKKKTI
jgi:hypothetical protein